MGRHTAADGATRHPLVAAALSQRLTDAGGAHRDGGRQTGRESGLGWPGPPPSGSGVGWPGDLPDGSTADGRPGESWTEESPAAEKPAPPESRRGWRRFFGLDSAA